jgi:ketosteroid isomerase-like protein
MNCRPQRQEETDMPAHKPEECDHLLMEAVKNGDLDAAVALYEPTAIFVVSPDDFVVGHAAIREVLAGMAANATGEVETVSVVPSADGSIAVTRTKGSVTSIGPDGEPVTLPFHSVEVVRKQPDGTWRFVIDDPGGDGLSPAARATGTVFEKM